MNKKTTPKPEQLQSKFYDQLVITKIPVSLYLINGIRLTGVIENHDQFTVLVQNKTGGSTQMVYKAAISTVLPNQ